MGQTFGKSLDVREMRKGREVPPCSAPGSLPARSDLALRTVPRTPDGTSPRGRPAAPRLSRAPDGASPRGRPTRPHTSPHRRLHFTDTLRSSAFVLLAAGVVSSSPASTTSGAITAPSHPPRKAPSNRPARKFTLVCCKVFLDVARCRFWAIVCSRSNVGASGNERRATC